VALVRGYGGRLQSVVQLLEDDILSPDRFHELTVISTRSRPVSSSVIARTLPRTNFSHALERCSHRQRRRYQSGDDEHAFGGLARSRSWSQLHRGSADALRTWRQP
jgi:hypothetical protein